jgi:hypothetical protein
MVVIAAFLALCAQEMAILQQLPAEFNLTIACIVYLCIPYGKEQPVLWHLVQEVLHTGVISTGVPTPILNDVIEAPLVAHLKLIGVVLSVIPLQSRYTTNFIIKLS